MPRFQKGRLQGVVEVTKYGYRVGMKVDGRSMHGPLRDSLAKAEADLARARACDDKEGLLRRLMLEAGKEEGRGRRKKRRGDAREEAQALEAIQAEARTTSEPARPGLPPGT